MSERAREFLDEWLFANVQAVPDVQKLREAVRLVAKCRKDAVTVGLPLQELRAVAAGDMIRCMLGALDAAAFRTTEAA
jgi:hypothetical protein